jgi:phage shock protein A
MTELEKLKKKLARLEKKYDKAEGKPLVQARILKSAESVQNKINELEGGN